MRGFWKEAAKFTRAIWYSDEEACAFCDDVHGPVCQACTTNYFYPELGRCRGCGKLILAERTHCSDCDAGKGPILLDRVTAWGHYSGALREFIHNVKFKGQPRRLMEIAQPFADWAISQLPQVDGVVAVPMHEKRLAERGYNQAEVIASMLHWEIGLPILQGVERLEPTTSQVSLSRQERLKNMKGAFTVRKPENIQGRSVWLVDDVTTTGATLEAVADILRRSGVRKIYGLCLAAGLEKGLVPSED